MERNLVETVMGAVVLVVAGMFLYFAYTTAQVGSVAGYELTARFSRVGGLAAGSDVRVNGIKIGTVVESGLDPNDYAAVVRLSIDNQFRLPKDTVAAIGSDGIIGDKYLRLEPGSDKTLLAAGETITKTKDYRSLEDQVGEILFLATGSESAPK